MVRALLATIAALLAAAPPAGADVALRDDPRAAGVAIAGRDVLIAREGRDGRVAIDAANLDGAPPRRLLAVPSPGRGWTATLGLAASAQRVALLATLDDERGETREFRLYSGPPSGPLTLARHLKHPPHPAWIPLSIDVDGDRLLLSEFRARDLARARARVLAPGGEADPFPWPGNAYAPAGLAGDFVAFVGSRRRDATERLDRVFVANRHSGAIAATLVAGDPEALDHEASGLDLASDGRLVASLAGRLNTVAPGAPQAAIPGDAVRSSPRFAGALIVALEGEPTDALHPVVVAPDGVAQPLGAPSAALEQLVADAHGAAWLANGCVRYAALDGSQPAAPPARCPSAEVVLEPRHGRLRGRTVRVDVVCVAAPAAGCRGAVLLRGDRGRGHFAVPAGERRRVAVRLTRRGYRRLRARVRRVGEVEVWLAARVRDGRESVGSGPAALYLTRAQGGASGARRPASRR